MMKEGKIKALAAILCLVTGMLLCLNGFSGLVSYADQTGNISIAPAFGGWENWTGSPNNPTPGGQPGVTQLLVGISDENGEFPETLDTTELDYTLTFDWLEGDEAKSKTINIKPATVAAVYKLVRFETVLASGENQFIPYKDQAYTLTLSVTDQNGVVYSGKSANGAFAVPMYPVVNGVVDQSYVYQKPMGNYPYNVRISQYHSGTVEIDGVECHKADWEMWSGKEMLILLVAKDDVYSLSDIGAGTGVGLCFNGGVEHMTTVDSVVDMGSSLLLRLPTEQIFTPEDDVMYSVKLTVYKTVDDKNIIAYTGTGEGFSHNNVAVAPQTGDGAMIYIGIAVLSVIAMAYILMPKTRKTARLA